MSIRPVKHESMATPTTEGAGVKLHRVFGFGDPSLTDPFLMMDDFRNDNPNEYLKGFPWHPHPGIETITYALAGTAGGGAGRARRQPRKQGLARCRLHSVDDGRQRHHAPGNAEGRFRRPDAWLPA